MDKEKINIEIDIASRYLDEDKIKRIKETLKKVITSEIINIDKEDYPVFLDLNIK